jgi:hypothetical protein
MDSDLVSLASIFTSERSAPFRPACCEECVTILAFTPTGRRVCLNADCARYEMVLP